jgi:hypothetical protein
VIIRRFIVFTMRIGIEANKIHGRYPPFGNAVVQSGRTSAGTGADEARASFREPLSRDQLPKPVYFGSGFIQLIGSLIQEPSVEISGRRACQTRILPDLLCPSSKPFGDSAHLLDVNHSLLLLAGFMLFQANICAPASVIFT